MPKKIRIILIILFSFFLVSCGYKKVIQNDIPVIYIKKETDIYNNIFLYMKLIEEAQEIHCIDSSFIHLVERSETKAKLFFHNIKNNKIKGANLELVKNWEIIDYL